jgi:hypothetical protein
LSNDTSPFQPGQNPLEAIYKKLDRLDEAIRGNGKPGIQLRLDRLEQNAKRQSRLTWLILGGAATAAGSSLLSWLLGSGVLL